MESDELLNLFSGLVGRKNVIGDGLRLLSYSYDASQTRGAPDIVVRPSSTEEVSEILRTANEAKLPVTPRGAGTSLVGGPVPIHGGVILDTLRMDEIIEIDEENSMATLKCGVTISSLNASLGNGLVFPLDPDGFGLSTVGGILSEDSACSFSPMYGSARDNVLAIEVVTAEGKVLELGGEYERKDRNLVDLFIGSEGILGLITKAILKLWPKPEMRAALFVKFADSSDPLKLANEAERLGIGIAGLHVLYHDVLEGQRQAQGEDYVDCAAIVELRGDEICMKSWLPKLKDLVGRLEPLEQVEAEMGECDEIWKRTTVIYDAIKGQGATASFLSASIARDRIRDILQKVDQASMRFNLPTLTVFHPLLNWILTAFLFHPQEKKEHGRVKKASDFLSKEVRKEGGTLGFGTGVGISMAEHFSKSARDATSLLETLKGVLDPNMIMNPGKMILKR